ncbi:MAG: DNA polymerase I, partial [Elusimicrobia bacterium]|nr:DNA polymerase I [Elusimicrobiota bacterium]
MKKNTPNLSIHAPRLYLIDAHAYLHKSHNAISGLTTQSGVQTGALYGFARMLLGILKNEKPDYLCVCFDAPGSTFRHKEFKEYKSQRPELEEGLRSQLSVARQLVEALGLRALEKTGYEADDIMATLARKATRDPKGDLEVVLVTPDKDVLQLVGPKVRVLRELQGECFDFSKVQEKYHVTPEQWVDFLALVGDAVDNLKGAEGVGPVRAAELLNRFGSLEGLLAAVRRGEKSVPPKIAVSVEQFSKRLLLNRRLITLEERVPMVLEPRECEIVPPRRDQILPLFKRLEFFSLLKEVLPEEAHVPALQSISPGEMKSLLEKSPAFALASSSEGLALGLPGGKSIWIEWAQSSDWALLLEDEKKLKLGHDLKSLLLALRAKGISLKGPFADTMIAAYCLNPSRTRYGLGELFLERLGQPITLGLDKNSLLFQVQSLWSLWESLEKEIQSVGVHELFRDLEVPLIPVLAEMEWEGVGVDEKLLRSLSVEFEQRIQESKKELDILAGMEINLNSPKQLSSLLFEKLKLPVIRKTKTGYSTDEEVLKTLAALNPIPAKIIEYRELAKLKSTYIENLLTGRDARTGRVHTSFNQAGTATGRLSSVRPNLQNIPIRSPLGQKIRSVFIPRPGMILLSADYSQIDLRVLAHITRDDTLKRAFESCEDFHLQTACEVFRLKPEEVTSEVRRRAKAINFGVVYGQTPHGLAGELGIPYSEAQQYIQKYFEKYAGVAEWIRENLEQARKNGFVKTLLGRIRYLPELQSSNAALRAFGERMAVNTPVQGGSADIIKKAMINIYQRLQGSGIRG